MNKTKEQMLNEALNRYYNQVKEVHPNLSDRDILEMAANMAITEVEGTKTIHTNDGHELSRVDHAWQQSKGSKISDDGFHKEGFATITLPKEIDVNTPEGDKKAGDFVEHLRAARKRGAKIEHEMKKKEWEDRKVQVTVNKEGV